MDRLIYTSMSGAKYLLERQATLANNLANATTTGFRADTVGLRAVPAVSPQAGTRVFTVETTTGADFSQGPTTATGRTLDVAIQGQGWLTVQAGDGSEAYTRNGSLQVGPDGTLQLPNGLQVQGTGGPISIPADAQSVLIATDGTVSVKAASSKTPTNVGQLKLVNPGQGHRRPFQDPKRCAGRSRCFRESGRRHAGGQQRERGGGDGRNDRRLTTVRDADEDAQHRRAE